MKYYMLIWKSNWADEMDIEGYMILPEDKYKVFDDNAKKIEKIHRGFSIGIGTNEDIDYRNPSELLEEIKVKEITEDLYKMLKDIGMTSFGKTTGIRIVIENDPDDYWNEESDEDDENGFFVDTSGATTKHLYDEFVKECKKGE